MERLLDQVADAQKEGQLVAEMLERFKLFWNVVKEPMQTVSGLSSDYYSIYREDTKEEFQAVKENYEVFQNWELIEMVSKVAASSDLDLAKGGYFNGGRKVYLKLDTGSLKGIGENNDELKRYITVLNSHDGSSSLALGMTNITLSCANTFHRMYREMNTKIRHTSTMRDKIDELMRQVDKVREEEVTLYDNFMRMADQSIGDNQIKWMIKVITGVDVDKPVKEAEQEYSRLSIKKAMNLTERIAQETTQKGKTLWGLFSGVTSYTNRDVRTKRGDLLENKMVGVGYKIDNKAYNLLEKYV